MSAPSSAAALPPEAMRSAIDWHLALETADTDRWQDFVLWLEADADHRAAYDRVTQDDALLQGRPFAPAIALAPVRTLASLRPAQRWPVRQAWAAGIAALTRGDRFAIGDPFRLTRESAFTPLRPRTLRITLARSFGG